MLSSVSSVEEKVQFRQYVSMPVLSMSVLFMSDYLCSMNLLSMFTIYLL